MNIPTLLTLVALRAGCLGSGFCLYPSFDHRIGRLEDRTSHVAKERANRSPQEQLKAINEKLDRPLYDCADVHPCGNAGGQMKLRITLADDWQRLNTRGR
jgi:hypothetical protein